MSRAHGATGSALLVGVASSVWHLPPLLRKAGLQVASVTVSSPYFRLPGSRGGARRATSLTDVLAIAAELATEQKPDLVVTSDDLALRVLRDWDGLSDTERLMLAPVVDQEQMDHLASKTTMTMRLQSAGVPTPRSLVTDKLRGVSEAAGELGWPVVVKNDFGAGGRGVCVIRSADSLAQVWGDLARAHARAEGCLPAALRRPMTLVVQEFLEGDDLDLSAFFRGGRLVHYSLSRFTEVLTTNGASSQRRYLPTATGDVAIANELNLIGASLGLDGFASITARESIDRSRRYYFEVDARPNLWCHVGADVGDDPIVRLRRWFATGEVDLSPTRPLDSVDSQGHIVRMGHRSTRRALLRNEGGAVSNMAWGTPDAALVLASALLRGPIKRR